MRIEAGSVFIIALSIMFKKKKGKFNAFINRER